MKKLIFIVVVLSAVAFGCDDGHYENRSSNDSLDSKELETPDPTPTPIPVSVVTPEMVALSAMKTEFTPYPDCDGGECYSVEFTVAIKAFDEPKIRSRLLSFGGWVPDKGRGKLQDEVAEGNKLFKTLSSIDPKKLVVTITDNEITKISTIEEVSGRTFVPEEVLWEKDEY